jgi:hypothetical protein
MEVLTRDRILAAPALAAVRVEVPEWGGAVFVRAITAGERDVFERRAFEGPRKDLVRAALVVLCAADAQGRALFTDADVEALAQRDAAPMQRIFNAACRLNAIGPAEVAELEQSSVNPGGSG